MVKYSSTEKEMLMLPEAFTKRMKGLLGEEYESFISTFDEENVRGVRVNSLKIRPSDFTKDKTEYRKLPYSDDGYILESDEPVGKTPEHHAGIIYMQDPGAMAPLSSVDIDEGAYVLDMCSAPGGKSGQAAAKIKDGGFLLSNEYVSKRAKITVGNFERLGIKNAIVTNLDTAELVKLYRAFFDVVIADVPCSGEGMFRKNEEAVAEWSEENVKLCSERQRGILKNASHLVKCGGRIIYSTCTWSIEENEEIIRDFLTQNENFELIDVKDEIKNVTRPGTNLDGSENLHLERCRRFYPHISEGEGQFLAVLRRTDDADSGAILYKGQEKPLSKDESVCVKSFLKETIKDPDSKRCVKVGNNIVLISHGVPVPPSSVFSSGVLLGEVRKGILFPSHQFFSAYGKDFIRRAELSDDGEKMTKYLRGEEIEYAGIENGYCVITYLGAPVGGGKAVGGRIKNHYPKGLRNT